MKKARPRILYLAPAWPHERSFGKQLRLLHLGRALQHFGEVNLVIASDTADAEVLEKSRREFQVDHTVSTEQVPPLGFRQRLKWWLDSSFQDPCGSIAKESDRVQLRENLEKFDLIWINSVRAANMFGLWRWPHSVLDIDDIPSTFELTKWRNGDRFMDRLRAGARTVAWRRREKLFWQRFTVLGVCSEADRQYLGGGSRIHVIPNGFEQPAVEPSGKPVNPPRLGFIGLFSYQPNLEGVRWFMERCWPRIKSEVPDAKLRLIGQDSDGPLKPADPDVAGLGWMADPSGEIATWSGMIVPLQLGSGTRVKVAEAFSRKCPLISTPFGARGYDFADGKELLLAETPEAFARACIYVMQKPSEAAAMAQRAWRRYLEDWTWEAIAPRVWATAEHCLKLSADGSENGKFASSSA